MLPFVAVVEAARRDRSASMKLYDFHSKGRAEATRLVMRHGR